MTHTAESTVAQMREDEVSQLRRELKLHRMALKIAEDEIGEPGDAEIWLNMARAVQSMQQEARI